LGKISKKSNDTVILISKYGCWKIRQKFNEITTLLPKRWSLEKSAESPTKQFLCFQNMVVGKVGQTSNEMVTLLPKHGGWKIQQKVQQNGYFAPETWWLENSAESPTKLLLCSRNLVGNISKKSNEMATLLPKCGCWKSQQKVQQNSSPAPETWSLEELAKSPTKWLLCSVGWKTSAKCPKKWSLCS